MLLYTLSAPIARAEPDTEPDDKRDDKRDGTIKKNGFMVVTAWRGGKRLKKWSGRAYWNGTDGTYIAQVTADGVTWSSGEAHGIKIEIEQGKGGTWLQAWLPRRTNMIKVVITERGFGENPDGDHGGDGTDKDAGQDAGQNAVPTVIVEARTLQDAIATADTDSTAQDATALTADDKRSSGSASADDQAERANGSNSSAKGKDDGDSTGQLGGRTREQGGVADAYASTLTGESHGDKEGGKGGDGSAGDAGARGAWGLIGIINIPRGWRAAAEVALIANEVMTPSTSFKSILKKGVRGSKMLRIRHKIRRQARAFANKETRRMEAQFAEELAQMSAKEREYLLRATKHQKQRQFFQKVEDGARNQRRHLGKKLELDPENAELRARLDDATKVEKAAAVKPVEGRLPLNHEHAGAEYPLGKIDATRYPDAVKAIEEKGLAGVSFTREGFPDFSPWIYKEGDVAADVRIIYTGKTRTADFSQARKAMRERIGDSKWREPADYSWHHHEDVGRMVLVPRDLNDAVGHTGGVPHYRMSTGNYDAYQRTQR